MNFHHYKIHNMGFQSHIIKFLIFSGYKFFFHNYRFCISWLHMKNFKVTCYHEICNPQVKQGNGTICTSIIHNNSIHNVKFVDVKY
jgi:hypothetical protein